MKNRLVPTDIVLPDVPYQDVDATIAWLTKTFGFTEYYRYGDPISGAHLHLGKGLIMVRRI